MKLVILDGYTENPGDLSWDWLNDLVDEYIVYDRTLPEDVLERSKDADILVTNKTVLTGEMLQSLPKLKFISTLSTGYNVIDTEVAKELGIPVSNIPAYSTDAVAQLVFALLLELTNHVAIHDKSVKDGEWTSCDHFCYTKTPLCELRDKTFGIVGFGKIGSAVAQIALAFGMKVIATTRTPKKDDRVEFVSFDELLGRSDYISVNCPLTPETRELFGKEAFEKYKNGAYFINTARGGVVDEQALFDALSSGKLSGAAIDVLTTEPMREDCILKDAPNITITPHVAWAAVETRRRVVEIVCENVKRFAEGKPQNLVN
jgi:glycerate dehydrogenase